MSNLDKYCEAFIQALDVRKEQLKELKYRDIPTWDSVGHMSLISNLEDEFDVSFETDDIIEFNSFEKGIEILRKYDVNI